MHIIVDLFALLGLLWVLLTVFFMASDAAKARSGD
jgi:hypothetical protein